MNAINGGKGRLASINLTMRVSANDNHSCNNNIHINSGSLGATAKILQ